MNPHILKLQKKQKEVEDFFEDIKVNKYDGPELRKQLANATSHFVNIGVNDVILNKFIDATDYSEKENGDFQHGLFEFKRFSRDPGYSLATEFENGDQNPKIYPLLNILAISRMLVDRYTDEDRLVSNSLLKVLQDTNYVVLKQSMEVIEDSYQKRNFSKVLSSLVIALDEVIKLIPDESLQAKGKLKDKLEYFYNTKDLYMEYSAGNRDIIWGLNNSRIIRNTEEHPKEEYTKIDINLTSTEVVGYVHLLLLLINCLLATGVITNRTDD